MNEVKKLYEMGIVTPQTLYYLAQQNKTEPSQVYMVEQEPRKPLEFVGTLRVNEYGDIVHPPKRPEPPEEIDQSNWKRITPKRREMLAQYRRDLEFYEVAMVEYHIAMEKWMELTPLKYAPPHEPVIVPQKGIAVFQFPCGKWHKGFGGNYRRELPYDAVEHHTMEVKEFEEGNWVTLENYDPVWRAEEHARMRTWYRQHRQEVFRATDTTTQLTLDFKGFRSIDGDILHTFTDNPELGFKFLSASMEDSVPCIHGSVNIPPICFHLTKEELEDVYRRTQMVRA